MKKMFVTAVSAVLVLAAVVLGSFTAIYFTRLQTIGTIEKVTDDKEYNLYRMDVKYNYSVQDVMDYGITDTQTFVDAILKEALPLLPVKIDVPDFGCSVFTMEDVDGNILMGRNYDFRFDTSAMLVYCAPKGGYRSVAFAALDNLSANQPEEGISKRLACLAAPFVCLDGMNEKGVSIAVLTLDSEPILQDTGKETIGTSLAIRLVLDQAATTQEAVDLLGQYDMLATAGRDYHFYITDASGDGRVIEYDCESPERVLTATPSEVVTNFYVMYEDYVLPDQRNGIYGHGRERFDSIEEILAANRGCCTRDTGWEALVAASQEPNPEDVTSNTQWSILYDDTNLTAEVCLRRDWENKMTYQLVGNSLNR